MELVLGIISVIAAIAFMPVIFLVGFLAVTVALGIIMTSFAGLATVIENIRAKKEIAKNKKEFEVIKNEVEEVHKKFRERMK